jgi:hypothetical protein
VVPAEAATFPQAASMVKSNIKVYVRTRPTGSSYDGLKCVTIVHKDYRNPVGNWP